MRSPTSTHPDLACPSTRRGPRIAAPRRPREEGTSTRRGRVAAPRPAVNVPALAAGMAHDFNNLLTVIALTTEHLLEPGLDPAERPALAGQIQDACARGRLLTRQLAEVGRPVAAPRAVTRLADELHRIHPLLMRTAGPRVAVVLDLAVAGRVEIDVGQLGQVLINLVANARDAMPEGGRVTIGTRAVDPAEIARRRPAAAGVALVALTVADGGTGMAADTLAHALDPFFTTKPDGRGTGLGLAMVRTIAEDHGGFVDVASRPGSGTRVTVYVPLASPAR
jgi:two-component system cell cycle sensor histidine kinase/response regulator CckA